MKEMCFLEINICATENDTTPRKAMITQVPNKGKI